MFDPWGGPNSREPSGKDWSEEMLLGHSVPDQDVTDRREIQGYWERIRSVIFPRRDSGLPRVARRGTSRRNITAMVAPIAAGESQEDGETPRRFV